MADKRWTIAVDFDGVIHSYTSPWVAPEVIPDPPVDGAIEWLNKMVNKFDVVIFTTRAKTTAGSNAVGRWLHDHGVYGSWTTTAIKPAALVYIDDRAWRFEGRFPSAHEIHLARPWNKPFNPGEANVVLPGDPIPPANTHRREGGSIVG